METFIGTKMIKATAMTRQEYNDYRGWDLPEDENGTDAGYLVEYLDSPTTGMPHDHTNYISWSPKEVFDKAYRPTSGMSFGLAVEALKEGEKVCRAGWNGKNMFLFLVQGSTFQVNRAPLNQFYEEGTTVNYCPHIDMKTADDKIVPWLASQTDVLADDWMVI